jgi:hypothetical protein
MSYRIGEEVEVLLYPFITLVLDVCWCLTPHSDCFLFGKDFHFTGLVGKRKILLLPGFEPRTVPSET